ncbi:MAG: DUF3795 domain-containing protein [Thermoplasmata archaeon]|nr:MAG: DUF3795 domain-containing protein [Thermoplasmata archaeon]
MKERPRKQYPSLGCCGLDCGLCPRYYTEGSSRCPGCAGVDFYEKHPSCGYITCCVKKNGLEVCAECKQFPCEKFEPWLDKCTEHDSFITHGNVKSTMEYIQKNGVKKYIKNQEKRIKFLQTVLKKYDDGRSKNFLCIASNLLAIKDLESSLKKAEQQVKSEKIKTGDKKGKAKILKAILNDIADKDGIELKLKK